MNFKLVFLLCMFFSSLTFFAQSEEIALRDTSSIIVPSEFSPNDDGVNDVLYVKANNVSNYWFKVFNRWGELIYETQDAKAGWNGKNPKGKPYPKAIYMYLLSYDDNFKNPKHKTGNIRLK